MFGNRPFVRNQSFCVCCGSRSKDRGLLLCWPCHNRETFFNGGGYSKHTENMLDRLERHEGKKAIHLEIMK
jgi:ribosomal protein L37AE/L43A